MTHRLVVVMGLLAMGAWPSAAQTSAQHAWSIYTSDGASATVDDMLDAAADVEIVLVGEFHDDTTAHFFQRALLEDLHRADPGRRLLLSLEMFERDVQLVVDEYLAGLITEEHFLSASRPWSNYRRDYRPLVEYARENGIAVLASNPPRRYVNLVARRGTSALDSVFAASNRFLPARPLPEPSEEYRELFFERMSEMPAHGEGPSTENLFEAQRLWDAGMAEALADRLQRSPDALILHLAGSFHIERDTGVVDALEQYRPEARTLSIVLRPDPEFDEANHAGLADFVVLTPSD